MGKISAVGRAAEAIREGIRVGRYPRGSSLPGERTISEQLGFSRMTVRAALQRLAEQGELTVVSQRGWFVNPLVVEEAPSTLQSFTEMAQDRGLQAGAVILAQGEGEASAAQADRLRLSPGARVTYIRRLRTLDAQPITVEDLAVPSSRARWLATYDMEDRSLYATLAEHGLEIDHSHYTVSAVLADEVVGSALQLPVGAAVLLAEETAYLSDGTPVLEATNRYRGDSYQFTSQLVRPVSRL